MVSKKASLNSFSDVIDCVVCFEHSLCSRGQKLTMVALELVSSLSLYRNSHEIDENIALFTVRPTKITRVGLHLHIFSR